MEQNQSINAGIEPGGMSEVYEVKILICYLLESIGRPMTREMLDEIFLANNLVNYFSYSSALSELLENGHLSDGEEGFIINLLGRDTSRQLSRTLPSSVKHRVVTTAIHLMAQQKKNAQIVFNSEQVDDGVVANCVIKDIGTDLLDLRLLVADELQAAEIERVFRSNPEKVYRYIVSLAAGSISDIIDTEK